MRSLSVQFLAVLTLAQPTAASACARPIFVFQSGNHRVAAEQVDMIDFAISEYRAVPGGRLRLVADASSVRLAQRQGEAVKAALIRRGVPAKSIDLVTRARGGQLGTVEIYVSAAPHKHSCG